MMFGDFGQCRLQEYARVVRTNSIHEENFVYIILSKLRGYIDQTLPYLNLGSNVP